MFIQRSQYLRNIQRIRVSEGRDLENGLRLDRNERVEAWGASFISSIFKDSPDWLMSVYPENETLYEKLGKFLNVDKENLLLTSGIDGGIKTIFEIMTSPGDLIGVLNPTYAMYKVYSNLYQTNLTEIHYEKDNKLNLKKLVEFIQKKPSIFFLPNPNQPIEDTLNIEKLEFLAKECMENNCLFFIDEAYHYFGADSSIELIEKYENVVVGRTFSKAFGVPSIRLGFLISNKNNMEVISKMRFAHESNTLSNRVAEYLIDNFDIVDKYIKSIIETRNQLKKILKNLGIDASGETGNYLLLDLKTSEKAMEFSKFMKDQKIYLKGPWKNDYSNYLTITLGPMEKMERFIDSIKDFNSIKCK